jgi:hypothetical protein
MKVKLTMALVAVFALLAVPATAGAHGHHHPLHCPKGKHRNGHKCVKNHVVRGPQGSSGPIGVTGPQGSEGPVGPPGPEGMPPAPSTVKYDNIEPASRIDNPVSLGYAATGTTEFGSQIVLTEAVTDPGAEVLMSVWTCEEGEWNADCETNDPFATFPAELTFNVYAATYENEVGELLSSTTETFDLRYRPTSGGCPDVTAYLGSDGKCNHGLPEGVAFDVPGFVPRKAIVSVEFTPSGPANSLNVGVEGPPLVGQNPLESREGVYWDSQWYGTPGPFSLEEESSEWNVGESQIAATITASN